MNFALAEVLSLQERNIQQLIQFILHSISKPSLYALTNEIVWQNNLRVFSFLVERRFISFKRKSCFKIAITKKRETFLLCRRWLFFSNFQYLLKKSAASNSLSIPYSLMFSFCFIEWVKSSKHCLVQYLTNDNDRFLICWQQDKND